MAAAIKLPGDFKDEETSMLQMKMTTKRMKIPQDDGMMNPMSHKLTDSMGVMDLNTVMDMDNEPDTNKYPGEDEEREFANDEVTRFHSHRRMKIVRPKSLNRYSSHDLWWEVQGKVRVDMKGPHGIDRFAGWL